MPARACAHHRGGLAPPGRSVRGSSTPFGPVMATASACDYPEVVNKNGVRKQRRRRFAQRRSSKQQLQNMQNKEVGVSQLTLAPCPRDCNGACT